MLGLHLGRHLSVISDAVQALLVIIVQSLGTRELDTSLGDYSRYNIGLPALHV